ncbi:MULTISPECIES: DUF6708 domain-containing protein [unclassified Gilliamella]|uniref:DUF6708 domain-containing protein n=1 Tax=unclassified Gilliamella TaxID=2685620 RepID=UPI00226A55AE|nr:MULTISPECIES: DUF6708 domain-containing protein [unclassified Gilliamella]MCX8600354.1 hypothetical protein [Gilliamella sp. B3722]MCX8609350.1 hypothetical protein [Gilliamella sp. B3771]MCX8609569.1 hypothetical protein [Gilliamella sp. B3891]MCX8612342.1 hypothetical protein [Gilliamella sp. B3773]MCX8615762.1 hypothetical protein [Gilliamella sp. B3770]
MLSKYQPQLSCWRQDLHKGVYTTKSHLRNNKKLRYANDDYCEFSRNPVDLKFFIRWFIVISLFILSSLCISLIWLILYVRFTSSLSIELTIGLLMFVMCCGYLVTILFLYILLAPQDCPIRLNRKTGKVYIYEHFILYLGSWKMLTSSPFKAKNIMVKEFNWSDIHGVMCSFSAPMVNGGMIRNYRIECVVCEPNTTYVIDHFLLAADNSLSYDEWMWINSYMAFSDNNLDADFMPEEEFSWPIKVNWPEEIDKKSKASSLEDYNRINGEYKN